MVSNVGVGVLLTWFVCACFSLRAPLELGRVFRDDCRNRLVRSLLPFGRLELLALDALPALAVTLASSVAVTAAAASALGADALLAMLLASALDLLLALSCGLDDPAAPVRLGSVLVTGFAGAVVCTMAYGAVLQFGFQVPVNYLCLALYGALGSLASQLGDLSFSYIKREYGLKDFGNIFPGHGGVLDRFDSVIFCAPLMELLIRLLPAVGV